MKLKIARKKEGDINIVTLTGKMDIHACLELKDTLKSVISAKEIKWHFNLEKVDYFVSEAIGTFISLKRDIEIFHGRITLCLSEGIANKFTITKLNTIFEIYDTDELALESYQ